MRRGRPMKLTQKLIKEAYEYLKLGNSERTTAQAIGISWQTWENWKNRGEQDREAGKKSIFSTFLTTIKKAQAEAIARNVLVIEKAAREGTWQAAAWWLERRYPEEWGKREKIDLKGEQIKITILPVGSEEEGEENGNKENQGE